jgi:hypothetical protein
MFDTSDFSQDFVNKNYDWNAAMQRASGQETATFSQVNQRHARDLE